ncbi:hypothetical protein CCR85_05835 [Rhodothalassium salexigens]|uniref:flagellar biosynthesis protein FlhF n=1 Tax=Rhodothalassium salexigens TaxID=1086 RepID=UPI001912AD16|nr:hypothetical protein [Rhodothalassium salexigens]MBK5911011.1 hypothetical protein [Rhodothalassium salexigens]
MRLKTFNARTMSDVMTRVRTEMGPDAIIVSIDQNDKSGVRVTAAAEGGGYGAGASETGTHTVSIPGADGAAGDLAARTEFGTTERYYDTAELTAIFSHHGVPYELAARLQEAATANDAASLVEALALALETVIPVSPMALAQETPIMLVGAPGVGKSITCAKLAAEARLNGKTVRLISSDAVKSGGIEQLGRLADLMQIELVLALDEASLRHAAAKAREEADLTLIDTTGTNPFNIEELHDLARLVRASQAEPVALMAAGLDPQDAADVSEVFASMGARRLIVTRLDTARRFASVLSAARAGPLALAGVSRSPYVADGVETPSYMALARLLAALPFSAYPDKKTERIA